MELIHYDCLFYEKYIVADGRFDLCVLKPDDNLTNLCHCENCKWYTDLYTTRKAMRDKRYIELTERGYVINKEEIC